MTNPLRIAIASILLLTGAAGAQAQDGVDSGLYLQMRLGGVVPMHDDLEPFDVGLAYETALGWRMHPNIAIEASVGRTSIAATHRVADPLLTRTVVETELATMNVLGTVKAILPVKDGDVYALAGVGGLFVSAERTSEISPNQNRSDDAATLGYHFGGGFGVSATPRLRIGGEVKYVIARIELDGFPVADRKYGLDGIVAGAMVGYTF